MKIRAIAVTLVIAFILTTVSTPAFAQKKTNRADRNITTELSYGTVQSIERVKLKSKAAEGAALGGIAGLAATHGDAGDNLAGAAAGAAAGALLAHALTKHKADAITIQRVNGSMIKVIMDHANVIAGDCVSIEEGSTTNLRRVSPEMCVDATHHEDEDIEASLTGDAEECHQAKLALLAAEDQESFDRDLEKVKILCY